MRFLSLSILSASLICATVWILLLFYFFPDALSARHLFLMQQCETFQKAEDLASTDFAQGKYTLILSFGNNVEAGLKRNNLLKSKYNIDVLYSRCVTSSEVYCYSYTMEQLLYRKYGDEFLRIVNPKNIDQYKSWLRKGRPKI
jgi:hypothetical protein